MKIYVSKWAKEEKGKIDIVHSLLFEVSAKWSNIAVKDTANLKT